MYAEKRRLNDLFYMFSTKAPLVLITSILYLGPLNELVTCYGVEMLALIQLVSGVYKSFVAFVLEVMNPLQSCVKISCNKVLGARVIAGEQTKYCLL